MGITAQQTETNQDETGGSRNRNKYMLSKASIRKTKTEQWGCVYLTPDRSKDDRMAHSKVVAGKTHAQNPVDAHRKCTEATNFESYFLEAILTTLAT